MQVFSKPCTEKVRTPSRHSQRKDPRLCRTCLLQSIERYILVPRPLIIQHPHSLPFPCSSPT
ncbi:hypothetical protein BDR07DRAFT_1425166 [Suillus spraguei]|nr:hypothetical protein BDR07DRAFT_1425166 [Suillus spraguei]